LLQLGDGLVFQAEIDEESIMTVKKELGIQEKIAAVAAGAIIISALMYWGYQFVGMLEFLEMAYE
jgi:hypothetical protein